ncbi:kinase-like protein [Gigaspora margarita]|uniref:Kinase-like protein n=1 Tax=Gigaspora margarita TaxID=4874 RepID=A0A8H3X6E7_GIGMA|nr:kinase-like protein [Gigaspora margarita]
MTSITKEVTINNSSWAKDDESSETEQLGKTYPQSGIILVLQYANNGNLRDYLQDKQHESLYKISWVELIKIAKEITLGLIYLHNKDIIHRDIHSKNILMNDNKVLIADFGVSKQLNDSNSTNTTIAGMPAYIEPEYIKGNSSTLNKKSDIYSLGVLFWELTSGVPPFDKHCPLAIVLEISKNKREKIIFNTPAGYSNIYRNCWSSDPNQRPTLDKIKLELEKLSTTITDMFIKNDIVKHYEQTTIEDEQPIIIIEDEHITTKDRLISTKKPSAVNISNNNNKRISFREDLIQAHVDILINGEISDEDLKSTNNALICYLEDIIKEYGIDICNYNEFSDFAKDKEVHSRAYWRNRGLTVALKSLKIENKGAIRKFAREHPRNILVHDGKIMLADFGISKQATSKSMLTTITPATVHEAPAYIDPKYLADHTYVRDEKSDIYSFGVILWEISSGNPPFKSLNGRDEITFRIYRGEREKPVKDAPDPYVQLYTRCWDEDPNKRPYIQEIFEILSHISEELKQKPETNLQSRIIKQEHFDFISKWIYKSSRNCFINLLKFFRPKNPFDYKLLIRGSRDGFNPDIFHSKCDNKGPTLTILKIKGQNEVLGGYNPLSWKSKENNHQISNCFIFNLNIDKPEQSIISKPIYKSIKSSENYGPDWGDLRILKDRECKCRRLYFGKPIMKTKEAFSIDDYEVFQILKI